VLRRRRGNPSSSLLLSAISMEDSITEKMSAYGLWPLAIGNFYSSCQNKIKEYGIDI
jgi:hypothetical protein